MTSESPDRQGKSLLFFVAEDWYFCSHRLPVAIAARDSGYRVHVVTRTHRHAETILQHGLNLIPIKLSRSGKNPFREIKTLLSLIRIYRDIRPDVVHHVAMKPVIYGAIAARLARVRGVVNALAGLGHVFSSRTLQARLLRPLLKWVFRSIFRWPNTFVIVQNPDDFALLSDGGIAEAGRLRLIMGSGVNLEDYRFVEEPEGTPAVLMASRMLWSKGVGEFVSVAQTLGDENVNARFVLAGAGDDENPQSIPNSTLEDWATHDAIDWLGHREDMPEVLAQSSICCLPTYYGEGVPKVLIEAASCGRPIITTDSPGCREIVKDGVNGLLVPQRDVKALEKAIRFLLESADERKRMGLAGRELVREHFSVDHVVNTTLAVYEETARTGDRA